MSKLEAIKKIVEQVVENETQTFISRKLRLADCILSIKHAKGSGYAERFAAWTIELCGLWDLTNDDLEQQREQVFDHLYTIFYP